MSKSIVTRAAALFAAVALCQLAYGQNSGKKELVHRVLQAQQAEIETLSKSVVERPAAQMMQQAAIVLQRQVPADKREGMGRAIEADVKKYVDEAYPLVRERALKIAPTTIGTVLEEKMSEEDLKQLVAWLESGANKRYQALGADMRNAFIQQLLSEIRPLLDPKVQALDSRIRVILGVPPAQQAAPASSAKPPASAKAASRAAGK
ncbi:MAG: hypothetical protein ABI641_09715 [Caldimonas sp.]